MKKYKIVVSDQAKKDLDNLSNVISYKYKSPITSKRYVMGIISEMAKLSVGAESHPIQYSVEMRQYQPLPRRLNFKQMTIIYNVINDVVYIRKIKSANAS